ncbi:hypothetical protein NA57DRAFT_43036 [Rhizodiscina lignyota]|uniref:N-acetylglucosamine-induced protein 1 n=1 Tax=Rhizodiscina lignyota TaxID=1504668 RepID=A0A9P4M4A8_9PEZI|nr:hypothetical protein NA57DRAFT_43036 [Rhizodiscina lignyota]
MTQDVSSNAPSTEINESSTEEPPPFPLTTIDRELLAMKDEDFTPISWDMLAHYISTNQLEELKRFPSQLRLYLAWSRDIKAKYGNVTNFILQERLGWVPLPSSDPNAAPRFDYKDPVPFKEPSDFKVLINDWPYGFAKGIMHIVVWLKTPVPADPETGMITDEGATLIRDFMERYFVKRMRETGLLGEKEESQKRVMWFKNWIKLQSVRAIEHVHVLVRGASEELLQEWRG